MGLVQAVADALRLGCSAIGFTIYPGSDQVFEMMEEIRELAEEAKSVGLAVVVALAPPAAMIPHAVLAGILVKVGYDIIDFSYLKRAHQGPRWDLLLMVMVLGLTVLSVIPKAEKATGDSYGEQKKSK